jgi:hypothetical protein
MTNYKIDSTFGPIGSSAGMFIFIAGLVITYFSLAGILFIISGVFAGFTASSTVVDFDTKRMKYGDSFCCFIKNREMGPN